MKTENAILEKSYAFAIRIVKLYRYLTEKKNEYVLSKQLLRSGTSIGAN
jgi:four helix bundle protein